jgi:hypothetical protein
VEEEVVMGFLHQFLEYHLHMVEEEVVEDIHLEVV